MPQKEKEFHIITEALSIFVLVPYLLYLNTFVIKDKIHKFIIYLVIISLILVDGYLFTKRNEW